MMNWAKLLDTFLGDPWRYLLIVLCIIFGFLQFFGFLASFGTDRVIGLILAFLGFISLSTLNLLKKAQSVAEYKSQSAEFISFKRMPPTLSPILLDAQEIWVCGVSAAGLIEEYADEIRTRFSKKKKTKFLLIDPNSAALSLVSSRDQTTANNADETIAYHKARIGASISKLEQICASPKANLEIRLCSYPLDFEYVLADYGTSKAIYFKHYPYKTPFGGEMRFCVENSDASLFEYYLRHLRNLWDHSDELFQQGSS